MGNRAQLVLKNHNLSIYLHWNGGPESIAAFLLYAEHIGLRHDDYYPARLLQIIGNFIGGNLSLGISAGCDAYGDVWDNGTYLLSFDGSGDLTIQHRGRTYSLATFVESVKTHPYWTAHDGTIFGIIAERNAQSFGQPKTLDE